MLNTKTFAIIFLLLLSTTIKLFAQKSTLPRDIVKVVQLDSVVVKAVKKGFSVADFIEMVKKDTSFAQAFENLRYANHLIDSEMYFYDKKRREKASAKIKAQQFVNERNCRWMQPLDKETKGHFYKKRKKKRGEYKYYTTKLFDHTFFTKDTVCMRSRTATRSRQITGKGLQKRKQQLKSLIFNPGSQIEGIPLISKKLAIFDDKMTPYYNYFIESVNFRGKDCYVFKIQQKTGLKKRAANKVVIDNLTSYFDKETFEIIARKYTLSYRSPLFDFEVAIRVFLQNVQGLLVPKTMHYNGFWDIPLKKPEIATFDVKISEVHFLDF